jgi:hypothetical protein
MKRFYIEALATVMIVALVVIIVYREKRRADHNEDQLVLYKQFCTMTRDAVHDDRRALEGSDSKKQAAALERFYESTVMYHNAESILMCVDPAEVPTLPAMCWVEKNVPCIEEVAHRAEDALTKAWPL